MCNNSWYSIQCFCNLTGAWFGKLLSWSGKYFQKDIVLGQAVQGVFHGKRKEKQKVTLISALFSKKRPKIALNYMPIHSYFIQNNKIWTVCMPKEFICDCTENFPILYSKCHLTSEPIYTLSHLMQLCVILLCCSVFYFSCGFVGVWGRCIVILSFYWSGNYTFYS